MRELIPLFASTIAATLALMFAVWLASLLRRDAGIADTFWGLGFVMIASVANVFAKGAVGRQFIVTMLVGLWGLRLSWHIALRSAGRGEDFRYRAMRERVGEAFWWRSLFSVFLLQGALMWLISLPIQVAQTARHTGGLSALDGLGLLVFALGFVIETAADEQLRQFRADPANANRVMNRGLWRYSRHPNYFGEALVWWGLWLFAAEVPGAWWTVFSPVMVTVLLVRVSGIPLLESHLSATRPGYDDYVRRTAAFFPRPPKKA